MTLRRRTAAAARVTVLLLAVGTAGAGQSPVKAQGEVELSDAAGDVPMMTTSGGDEPAPDVVSLKIAGDGRRLRLDATLAEPPGRFATSVVDVLIDSDGDPATGVRESALRPPGFDYEATVQLCIGYERGSACAGSLSGEVVERWSALQLVHFEGDDPSSKQILVRSMPLGEGRPSEETPVTGRTVTAFVDYADLGVESGETIRLLAREAASPPFEEEGYFPMILLTLE